jgi:hypothetical protein
MCWAGRPVMPAWRRPILPGSAWSVWWARISRPSARRLYHKFKVNTEGLQVEPGQTFRWSGVYEANMDNRRTLSTD